MNKNNQIAFLLPLLLLPGLARGLALGDAEVRSFLNEPLQVEVPLFGAQPGETADLKLEVAPQADFDRLGLARLPLHSDLRFEIVQRGGAWLVVVRSRAPIREPYVAFPLRAVWPDGQMVREFNLLLDPRPAPRPAVARGAPARAAAPAASPPARPSAETSYGPIRRGETLWPIARRLKPAGVSTEQMIMALLRANPQAFIDDNVNKLRAGAVLQVPDAGQIAAQTPAAARSEFVAQTEDWRGNPADVATPLTPSPAVEPAPAAAAEAESAAEASHLRILGQDATPTTTASAGDATIERRLLLALERAEAERLEFEALRLQVDQLQSELVQMRQLLELKDAQMEALRTQQEAGLDATAAPTPEVAAPAPAPEAAAPAPLATAAPPPVKEPAPQAPPAMVRVPDRAPAPRAADPLAGWWLWVGIGALLLLTMVLLLLWVRKRALPVDVPLARHPDLSTQNTRPYADAVARLGSTRPGTAQTGTPGARGTPVAPTAAAAAADDQGLHLTLDDFDHAAPPAAAAAASPSRDAPRLRDAHRPADAVSDDELESWVRDLADESDLAGWSDDDSRELLGSLDGGREDSEFVMTTAVDDDTESAELPSGPASELDDEPEPDPAVLRLELAQAYLEIGDPEAAREILTQLVEDSLSGPEQEEARRLLQSLG